LNVIVVPPCKFVTVNVPSPQSVFILMNLNCPSVPAANVKAFAPVVTRSVENVVRQTAPAPVKVCGVPDITSVPHNVVAPEALTVVVLMGQVILPELSITVPPLTIKAFSPRSKSVTFTNTMFV